MVVRVIEAKEDKITIADLIEDLKKSTKIDYSGAIFTFEGIVTEPVTLFFSVTSAVESVKILNLSGDSDSSTKKSQTRGASSSSIFKEENPKLE